MKSIRYHGLAFTLVAIFAGLLGCSGRMEETVTYDVFRSQASGFSGMDFLGIAKAKGVDKKHTDYLVNMVRGCGQFQKVDSLNKVFPLAKGDGDAVKKSLKKEVSSFQDSRYVHGVLVIELVQNEIKKSTKRGQLILVRDQMDHSWFDSYGNAAHPKHIIYGSEEIAPKVKYLGKKLPLRNVRVELGIRFALYNKNSDQLIFDQTSYIGASLSTYSKDPVINSASLGSSLADHLMERIARAFCPKLASVERTLYAAGDDSQADKLIVQGIDHVDEGDWEKAADQWKKAVLVDKKNRFALHNLGVYYERAGNVPAAMEEFQKAREARPVAGFNVDQYEDSLKLFRPKFNPSELEPHIYGISGAGWVSIFGGKDKELKPGRIYSVYRTKRLTAPPKFRVDGMELIEVGKVKIVKHDAPFMLGRIVQFFEPYRVEMGDVVILK